ncbi:MAG: class I SAM-dependent methyltransferase [Sphingomonadales bacterium]|nr:class I SAM-dependent methyltransferase [Sphingomonadaceae bacterium]MBS3930434.1 class I SAM-dependent methyltransferase [Sphingomonadales bacterium]
MTTKKKSSKSVTATLEQPKAGVLAKEHEERIDIERTDIYPEDMIKRHRERYCWSISEISKRFCRAGRVLDAACGTGYGSSLLLGISNKVVGLDGDHGALDHARKRFGGSLLSFRWSDLNHTIAGNTEEFDAAVTIETIEHLPEEGAQFFLSELHRVIAKNGLLLISTPEFNAERGLTSTFHLKEYTPNEMIALVTAAGFVDVVLSDATNIWVKDLPGFIFLSARKPG